MKRLEKHREYYLLFKYLWVIILLPKTVQLGALMIIAILLLRHGKIRRSGDYFTLLQVIVLVIHAFSIIWNAATGTHERSRIFAAINTFSVTAVALLFYKTYSQVKLDLSRIGKYCIINILILTGILIIYLVYPGKMEVRIGENVLSAYDYYNEQLIPRFVGMMPYANLVPLMLMLGIPFALYTKYGKKPLSMGIIFVVSYIIITEARSRTGQLTVILLALMYLYSLVLLKVDNKMMLRAILAAMCCFFVIVLFNKIWGALSGLISGRSASNGMRFYIYEQSWYKMISTNPWVGVGIKDIMGDTGYPYGSHSSYIGYFYKTGMFGGVLYLLSFFDVAKRLITNLKKSSLAERMIITGVFSIFVWMIFEDIDGVNWAICLLYAVMGIEIREERKRRQQAILKNRLERVM